MVHHKASWNGVVLAESVRIRRKYNAYIFIRRTNVRTWKEIGIFHQMPFISNILKTAITLQCVVGKDCVRHQYVNNRDVLEICYKKSRPRSYWRFYRDPATAVDQRQLQDRDRISNTI
jgi:hypothetical protein